MVRAVWYVLAVLISVSVSADYGHALEIDELLQIISREVSGNRARDYTMRM